MSDRKEENFDFESDFDDSAFSNTSDTKASKSKRSLSEDEDLDLLLGEDEVEPETLDTQPKDEVFGDIETQSAHHEKDFDHTLFDPEALSTQEEDISVPEGSDPPPLSLEGILQKVREGWPYYLGAICAVFFGIYLVSLILSDSSQNTPKAAPVQKASEKSFGLTLQDTGQYAGTLDMQKANSEVAPTTPVGNMDRKEMVELIQQAVNSSVDKISSGMNREFSEVGKNLKDQGGAGGLDEIKRMRKAVEMLVDRLGEYEQNLAKVDTALAQLTTQLNLLVAQKTAQSDNLSLRAVIPGRAWLVDTQGRTYTVTQGDLVGNFGKVVQIDAEVGRVITSSGYVFN